MRLRSIQIHRPAKSFHTLPMKICGSHISGSYSTSFTVVQALSNMIHTQFPQWPNVMKSMKCQCFPSLTHSELLYPWPPTKVGTLTPTISGWTFNRSQWLHRGTSEQRTRCWRACTRQTSLDPGRYIAFFCLNPPSVVGLITMNMLFKIKYVHIWGRYNLPKAITNPSHGILSWNAVCIPKRCHLQMVKDWNWGVSIIGKPILR